VARLQIPIPRNFNVAEDENFVTGHRNTGQHKHITRDLVMKVHNHVTFALYCWLMLVIAVLAHSLIKNDMGVLFRS